MLSAIRNSPLAKRLFGEPQPPDTSASTLTEVVSYFAASAGGDDTISDGHRTPPTQVPLRADDPSSSLFQDAVLNYEASRQAQNELQEQTDAATTATNYLYNT